ncbi:hypothetical protein EIP91_011678 [Steccherinum ochraceum]|uniref:Uncharacterized protein n=1 Tax=Steccherinum ochraceum TaxID=92696 RepID=A0A4R0RQM8_9APHY|nr:hypothetical protein EIP91_011678 [Steccherinum ochraceum]
MLFTAAFAAFVASAITAVLAVPIEVTIRDVPMVYPRDDFSLATRDVVQVLYAREDELTGLEKRGNSNCVPIGSVGSTRRKSAAPAHGGTAGGSRTPAAGQASGSGSTPAGEGDCPPGYELRRNPVQPKSTSGKQLAWNDPNRDPFQSERQRG